MPACVNFGCRLNVAESQNFCPHCGTDNRPPARQWALGEHDHNFAVTGSYCVICGVDRSEVERQVNAVKRGKLFTWIGAGLFGLAILFNIIVSAQDSKNYADFVAKRAEILARKEVLDPVKGPHFEPSPFGSYPMVLGFVGVLCLFVGTFTWINNRPKPQGEIDGLD